MMVSLVLTISIYSYLQLARGCRGLPLRVQEASVVLTFLEFVVGVASRIVLWDPCASEGARALDSVAYSGRTPVRPSACPLHHESVKPVALALASQPPCMDTRLEL